MELTDRIAVVTGGGSGIGAALARRLHAEGTAHVAVADLDHEAADVIAEEVGGSAHRLDVADASAVEALVETVTVTAGPIDMFFANAGVAVGGGLDADDASWQRSWDVNVMSQVYAARAVLPGMVSRGEGYLMLTASAAGLTTSLDSIPYAVTKHGSVALAEWLAIMYADRGITVSCLAPQFVDTPMGRMAGTTEEGRAWASRVMISPEQVADAVVAAIPAGDFLILPHGEVAQFFQSKAADYERWLGGMRKLKRGLGM